VYGIVKQSGGSLSVYSEPNRGSTFKVYLPRVVEPVLTNGEDVRQSVSTSGTGTVLIVEDEAAVGLLAMRSLLRRGYATLVARDGDEALRLSEQHPGPIHLLLTDVVLPKTSGPKLAASLVAARPELRVLYMSGFTESAVTYHGMLDPGTEFIQKPFSPQALALKVQEALRTVPTGQRDGPGSSV
jgi:two-component system cell cycle sensor histidine kinase/response regulator CckA